MKAVKKFERGGYKFTATLNDDYTCEVVSDEVSIDNGGFISNWSMIPIERILNDSISEWIFTREDKDKSEIEFIQTAKRHGFEIIENK